MQLPLLSPALAWLAFARDLPLTVACVGPLVMGDAAGPYWWAVAATGEHGWEETAAEAWREVDARKGSASPSAGRRGSG